MTGANYSPENIRDDDESRAMRAKVRNNFNYVTLTFNAIQTHFAQALQEVSNTIVKPALKGGFAINDVRYFGTLENAVAAVLTGAPRTVYITNQQSISSLTVPSNIGLVVPQGGSFEISGSLVIDGPFDAQGRALTDIFTGAGTYTFGYPVRLIGSGTPEAAVAAPVGSEYLRSDGGAGTSLYIKESGTGDTGWVAK